MSAQQTHLQLLQHSLALARHSFHRRLVVLCGSRTWSAQLIDTFLQIEQLTDVIWVGEEHSSLPFISAAKARQLLGRNLQLLVYDAWSGIHPDGLAAAAGSVAGGGLLILCAPSLPDWIDFDDPDYQRLLVHPYTSGELEYRFLKHFVASLKADPVVRIIEESSSAESVVDDVCSAQLVTSGPASTEDQQRAIEAIVHVLEGHGRRPLVMTSDRGRGKSAALGFASALMMRSAGRRLIITAPQRASVKPVFLHAAKALGIEEPATQLNQLEFASSSLCFMPPDEVVRQCPAADMLMVDEAAAIPAALLERMARDYNRIVFSTTVHGYEGTGRGFDIRFKDSLKQLANQVKEVQLQQPIRWAQDDPVERWLYKTLLLDAEAAELGTIDEGFLQQCIIERVSPEQLLQQPELLRQLFGLLILAHYQTTPSDLRNLLDGPNISVWISSYKGNVVAAALIAEEGGFDKALDEEVWRGMRRPRGHLIPQTLAAHAGMRGATELYYWRVIRIAVHKDCQRYGVGSELVQAIVSAARRQQVDLLGSSFAATADVVSFWRAVQCTPVRLGIGRDASSGCHSAIVLSALSEPGDQLLQSLRWRFAEQFPRLLESTFRSLEPALVSSLLIELPLYTGYYMQQLDWLDCETFARGARQFEDARLALYKLLLLYFSECLPLQTLPHGLLIRSVAQCWPLADICRELDLTGKKHWLIELRQAVDDLLQHLLDNR